MLAFTLSGRPFLLDESTSVRITSFNPACFFDKIEGDVGMGISIPDNDNNRALLGNPGRFERDSTPGDNEFPGFEVRFSGLLLLAGTLVIQGFAGKAYNGWLRSNVGNLGKEHREKFIYDIAAFDKPITFTNKANYDPETDPYGCPEVYNPDFFKGKGRRKSYNRLVANTDWYAGSDKEQFINDPYESEIITIGFRNYAGWKVNKRNEDNTVKLGITLFADIDYLDLPSTPITVVSPMLFLSYTIKTLLEDAQFFIDQNAIADDADLKKLLIYNNYDITKMGFGSTEPITINSPFYDATSDKSRGIIINYVYRNYSDTFKYRDLLPKTKLKDFLLGVQNLLNVCFHFLPTGKVNIIDREAIIASTPIDITRYMVGDWEISEKKDVTLKFSFEHDKDDTYFSERWEDIDDRREDEKEPVETWDELIQIVDPQVGEVRYIKQINNYAEYAWYQKITINPTNGNEETTDMLGWQWVAQGFQNGFFNTRKDQQEEIKTVFSTLAYTPFITSPETQQPGNIKSIKFAYASFTPRLLFYLGNNMGKYETDTLALDWEKDEIGLIAARWPKWARFWSQRRPVSREADLPLNVLDYISRNITNKFRTDNGEFIVETLETEFRLNGFGPTKITGYKNGYVPNTYDLAQHWAPGNLILMDELIDFTGFDNMNFDLWP